MSVSKADIDFAVELFDGLGPLTTRKMMGGLCIYRAGTIFAIVRADGGILLKGAGDMAERMQTEGWAHWTFTRDNGKSGAMPYWALTDAALDDPEYACELAQDALNCL